MVSTDYIMFTQKNYIIQLQHENTRNDLEKNIFAFLV